MVSPHPDDETLLFGGLIARHARLGAPVTIVAVTDGEAGRPRRDRGDLASLRRREQRRAVDILTAGAGRIIRLGLPDSALAAVEEPLVECIRTLTAGDVTVAAPSLLDHHRDHLAVARSVACGARRPDEVLWGFFWAWHHRRPDELAARPLVRLDLDATEYRRRATAIEAHASQVTDRHGPRLLGPAELAPIRRTSEVYEQWR